MSRVRELHDEAMRLANLAMVARYTRDVDRAEKLAREALQYESQAAELIPYDEASEPTRAILFRSAASLAYQCRDYRTAFRLLAKGLSGYPPPRVEQELRDLCELVSFASTLKERGATLAEEDIQLLLRGDSVGLGTVLYNELISRIDALKTIIERTMERLTGASYRSSGRAAKSNHPFVPALAAGQPGSFSITMKLVVPSGEQTQCLVTAPQVIDEVIVCAELVSEGKDSDLEARMGQRAYATNFVSMIGKLAPDGEKIQHVGFVSTGRAVSLAKRSRILAVPTAAEEDIVKPGPVKVR